MSILIRKYFYTEATVDGDKELDYLTSTLDVSELSVQEFYTVDASTENRIDLISLKYYGTYHLGWLLSEYNNILDPIEGYPIGKVVRIPSLDEYYQFYNRNTRSA